MANSIETETINGVSISTEWTDAQRHVLTTMTFAVTPAPATAKLVRSCGFRTTDGLTYSIRNNNLAPSAAWDIAQSLNA